MSGLPMTWRIRRLLNRVDVDVQRYRHSPFGQLLHLMEYMGINVLFDVGANQGQFATYMRNRGYSGRIVSFEPLSSAFSVLERKASVDPLWEAVNLGLGNCNGSAEINIGSITTYSSLRQVEKPLTQFIGTETVQIRRVDSILDQYVKPSDRLLIKADTQGYERQVVEGSTGRLDAIACFLLELSVMTFYQGESLLPEMLQFMTSIGFVLMGMPGQHFDTNTGRLTQVDAFFGRPDLLP